MTSATNNPGLYPHDLSLDTLVEVGTDLYFAPGHLWLFVDSGYGEVNDKTKNSYQLTTAGIGWQTDLYTDRRGRLTSRVVLGYPLAHNLVSNTSGDLRDDGTQL